MTTMSINFSVFNGHVNDADMKARAYMREHCARYLYELTIAEKLGGGVMAIFDRDLTPETAFYAGMVCALVNKKDDLPPLDFYNALLTRQLSHFENRCAEVDIPSVIQSAVKKELIKQIVEIAQKESPSVDYNEGLGKLIEI